MMRLVLVNQCAPEVAHVCSVRARSFAVALARQGHQVLLLTQTCELGPNPIAPMELSDALTKHNWATPFFLRCPSKPAPFLQAARSGRLPVLLRKLILGLSFLFNGGVFSDWKLGARPYLSVIANDFQPHGVWGTFGITESWLIAQALAKVSNCPWVMDIKDPWNIFIPKPFRQLLSSRFADACAATALSAQHAAELNEWFHHESAIIYSGIDDVLLPAMPPPTDRQVPKLLLIGSLYDNHHFNLLLDGVRKWSNTLEPAQKQASSIVYVGEDKERFLSRTQDMGIDVQVTGWINLTEIRQLAEQATVLTYVRSPRAYYQHKVLELAALDRPILCLPPESQETRSLLKQMNAKLFDCDSSDKIAAVLEMIHSNDFSPDYRSLALPQYSWDIQASQLARVMQSAVSRANTEIMQTEA